MDESQKYYLGRVEKNTIVLKQNSETKKYISRAEYIKTENNRTQYRIAPIVSDIGILCINRTGLYLISLGQTGGVFNNASIKKYVKVEMMPKFKLVRMEKI